MAGINIDADIQARGFIKGVDDMAEALEDLQDSVTEVQKDGDASLEKLEKSFAEVAKASRTAGDDVKRGFGDRTKEGLKDAEGGLKDFKEESISTAKESAASFDGSAESIVDSFQEVAANAFVGFGSYGVAAGLAAAAGIGIASSALVQAEEDAKETEARIGELGVAMIESGSDVASLNKINDSLKLIVSNADDAVVKFKDLKAIEEKTGIAAEDLAMAYAGNEDAIAKVTDALKEKVKLEEESTSKTKEGTAASDRRKQSYEDQIAAIQQVQEETQLAEEIQQHYLETGGAEFLAKEEAISNINQAYDDVVNSVTDYVNKETGVLDVEAYINAMQQRADALTKYQTSLASSSFTTEQKDALNSMGIEAASAWMAGYESATPEQKASMEKFLTESATDSSGVAKGVIDEAFAKPTEAKVEAVADTATAQKTLDALVKKRTATIELKYVDKRTGQEVP